MRRSKTSLFLLFSFLITLNAFASAGFAQQAAESKNKARPNILFAIADDWSFGHAGAYGCEWINTPGFDRVAKQGILFTRAYTPNAKCAPSRAILLTGRNSWQLEQACNHVCMFPPKFTSFAEALAANGYTIGMTGKGWGPGIAKDANGKGRQMAGKPYTKRKAKPPAEGFLPRCRTGRSWNRRRHFGRPP